MEIVTDRLRLRPFEPRDTDELQRLWSLPEVRRYLWDGRVVAREEAASQIGASMRCFDEHGFGFWSIRTREPAAFAGFCGLRHFGDPPRVEVLYGLDPAYWHLGLATEAARAVLRFGFEQCRLERIYAGADAPNDASLRVMRRLGMSFAERVTGELGEIVYYVLARTAFSPDESYYLARRSDG
jgi:ribosomal-protein-alanine N-acetyltransferase